MAWYGLAPVKRGMAGAKVSKSKWRTGGLMPASALCKGPCTRTRPPRTTLRTTFCNRLSGKSSGMSLISSMPASSNWARRGTLSRGSSAMPCSGRGMSRVQWS